MGLGVGIPNHGRSRLAPLPRVLTGARRIHRAAGLQAEKQENEMRYIFATRSESESAFTTWDAIMWMSKRDSEIGPDGATAIARSMVRVPRGASAVRAIKADLGVTGQRVTVVLN